jgi:hypothetical protein
MIIGRGRKVCIALACAFSLAATGVSSTAYGRWSSGVLLKREESGLAIKGFQPKMAANSCLRVQGRDAKERLICRTFWTAEGQKMTSISEVIVIRQNGSHSYEFKPIIEARDTSGARGANVVGCEPAGLELFEIKRITRGAAPGLIAFDASYAARSAVERVCADKGRNAQLGTVPLDEDEAYIQRRDEEKSALQLDIHHGAVAELGGRSIR